LILVVTAPLPAQMAFEEEAEAGIVKLVDGGRPVLVYRFGDQRPAGVGPRQTRSCYIHPLYSLDGEVLTDDFPKDHLHHHGLFWTWPVVRTRGKETQTWHPADPSLRQRFVRWWKRDTDGHTAILTVENAWILAGKEKVAREILTLEIHAEADGGRAVDFELILEAVGGILELRGTPDLGKGYGGLCLRGAPVFTGAVLTTDEGEREKDATNRPFRWADLSTETHGVAIFTAPDHPGFPVPWLIRRSYAGVLNPSWPGMKGIVLHPGRPIGLRYRIFIHRGNVESGNVAGAYRKYLRDASRGRRD